MSGQRPNAGKRSRTQGVYYSIMSFFRPKPDPKTPIKGCVPRIKNLIKQHFRGIFGMLVPICALTWQGDKDRPDTTVQCMWMLLFWFFLLQPVAVPVTSLIPVFLLPMTGVLSTPNTCSCYMNESVIMFIVGSILVLLLNNSGADRRIALGLICSGDNCQFSGKRLVFKCSVAAFFLSMFSNRLIVSSTITQYLSPALIELQASTASKRATEPNYNDMRYIILCAIQTSSSIGSIAIIHSSYGGLCFRGYFSESAPAGKEWPDIFNYMQYTAYAFPVSFIMFVINFAYYMILINKLGKPMSAESMTLLRSSLLKYKGEFPNRTSLHEKISIFFMILALVVFFLRWSTFLNMGWAEFSREVTSPQIPGVKDATVGAFFAILLHILPKGYQWLRYFSADKQSELPPLRPESAILFWRFVDKNVNYGYMFVLGCGVSLTRAIKVTGLNKHIASNIGKIYTDHQFPTSLFMVCLTAAVLSNCMSGVAAMISFLPLVVSLATEPTPGDLTYRSIEEWPTKMYLAALGVGISSSLGFMFPFLYTPAYYCHFTGKVPMKRMAKYGFVSAIICLIILWLSLVYYAPVIWDPDGVGVVPVPAPGAAAPAAGGNRTMVF